MVSPVALSVAGDWEPQAAIAKAINASAPLRIMCLFLSRYRLHTG